LAKNSCFISPSCPVCNQNLDEVGDAQAQETHVKQCLEGNSGTPQSDEPQPAKYLVYRLPAESALLGMECMSHFSWRNIKGQHLTILQGVICLEEFIKGNLICNIQSEIVCKFISSSGSTVARLSCFCSFHSGEFLVYILAILV